MFRKVPHGEKGGLKTGTQDCKYLISALNAVHIFLVKSSTGASENGGYNHDLFAHVFVEVCFTSCEVQQFLADAL